MFLSTSFDRELVHFFLIQATFKILHHFFEKVSHCVCMVRVNYAKLNGL